MKYIRTYETEEKFLADKDSTSREFRLSPVLYKYDSSGDHVHLELDDPRKYRDEGSTYMEITLDSDTEFSFYIGNAPDNTETTMDCRVNWGDGTVDESLSIVADSNGFKLSHNYKAGSYSIELHKVARDYSIIGDTGSYKSLISHPSSVKRVILGEGNNYGVGGVVSIGLKAFLSCTSLTSIHIPESVTSIGDSAFEYCSSLISVYIPESVTKIGKDAFRSCRSLTSVYIPEGVTSIGEQAFYGCHSLTSAYIPSGVTIIKGTFRSCESLTSVHIPEGVTSIGSSTFNTCSSLTSISIPGSVTSIDEYAFSGCSLTCIFSLNTTAPTLEYDRYYYELPTNGTLYIKPGATGYDAWMSKLPSGWVIVEDL